MAAADEVCFFHRKCLSSGYVVQFCTCFPLWGVWFFSQSCALVCILFELIVGIASLSRGRMTVRNVVIDRA